MHTIYSPERTIRARCSGGLRLLGTILDHFQLQLSAGPLVRIKRKLARIKIATFLGFIPVGFDKVFQGNDIHYTIITYISPTLKLKEMPKTRVSTFDTGLNLHKPEAKTAGQMGANNSNPAQTLMSMTRRIGLEINGVGC